MPRFNVQHPVTKEWRCFSTIIDDYVTDWMDEERYPLIPLTYRVAEKGGSLPAVLNAANEAANLAFREERIGFTDIEDLLKEAIDTAISTLEEVDRLKEEYNRQEALLTVAENKRRQLEDAALPGDSGINFGVFLFPGIAILLIGILFI